MELLLSKLIWVLVLVHQALSFCPPFLAQEKACTCFAYLDGAVIKCKGPGAPSAVEKLKAVEAEVRELSIEDANIVEVSPTFPPWLTDPFRMCTLSDRPARLP